MKTILYNTVTKEVKHHKSNGYYEVMGKRPKLGKKWKELAYINTAQPDIDSATERVQFVRWFADIENAMYIKIWEILKLDQHEIDLIEWKHEQFPIKLVVDESVLFTPTGIAYKGYVDLMEYPIEMIDGKIHIWVPNINEAHAPFINQLKSSQQLTEEQRPELD